MQFPLSFEKNKVIQGLRYHFISRPEIKILLIVINVFAILSAILFYMKKVQPMPFILSAFLWMVLMVIIWMVLPRYIYSKSPAFKESYITTANENYISLETEKGTAEWEWSSFESYFESPNFFHLYFNKRSFFLIQKDAMTKEQTEEFRSYVVENISRQKVK